MAIDDRFFIPRNNQPVKGANQAGSGYVNILKVDTSNIVQLTSQTQIATTPTVANDVANKAYVDAQVGGFEFQNSVITQSILDPSTISGTPSVGDRYLINGTGAGGWSGKDNQIAQYVSGSKSLAGSWSYTVPSTGEFVSADDQSDRLYYFGGSSWSAKFFEDTTASTGLTKVGNDIQLASSSAGAGLTFTSGVLDVVAGDASVVVNANELHVQVDGAGAIITGGSGIKVQLESSNPSLQISSNKLGVKLDGAGAIVSGASGIAVQLESSNPTLQISSDKLGVKLDGAGAIVTGVSGIAVAVDGATIKISSDALKGLTPNKENFTLSGTNITNQYIDLAQVVAPSSLMLMVEGLVMVEGTDYTLSTVSSHTRVTFAGDLATGGIEALISGDKINTHYLYL